MLPEITNIFNNYKHWQNPNKNWISCLQCNSIHSSLRLIYMWPVNTGRASIFSMIWQIFSHKPHWKYLPWDIAWQDRQTQWCPGGRQWISSVGYWGQGSGSEHQSSAWCVWCCCRCGPSWRDDAAPRCPAACSRGWQRPGSQPGVPRAWLFLPGEMGETSETGLTGTQKENSQTAFFLVVHSTGKIRKRCWI